MRTINPACLVFCAALTFPQLFAADVEWSPLIEMGGHIFPSYVIASATIKSPKEEDEEKDPYFLGEPGELFGISITAPSADARVRVEVRADAILETSAFEGTLARKGKTYTIYPKAKFKYDKLLDARQQMPFDLVISVSVGGKPAGEKTQTLTLRSINDCPYSVYADDGTNDEDTDISWMFAAYVNEDHPLIDQILKEALASKIVSSFDGYQSGEAAQVYAQVYAIWHALQKRGIKYSNITKTAGHTDKVGSQHVRFFDESINNEQANCVDGSVLMASILRKIDIEPYLVFVPGHCYLAFSLDEDKAEYAGLETTMLGDTEAEKGDDIDGLAAVVGENWSHQRSYKTFVAAVNTANSDLQENDEKFKGGDPDYQMIDIEEARKLGVTPIAYKKAK